MYLILACKFSSYFYYYVRLRASLFTFGFEISLIDVTSVEVEIFLAN